MSSYSFSHQFYQHWTQAPEPVRVAIVQELEDITSLLQTETAFEEFVFTTHDLDARLDELYKAHDSQKKAEKELAEKQEKQRAAAEQQRLAEEKEALDKQARAKAEAERQKEQELAQAREQQEQKANALKPAAAKEGEAGVDTSSHTKNADDNININDNISSVADNLSKRVVLKPKKGAAIDLSLKDPTLNAAHKALIRELEMHVDDYLSEQMMQISEDLKSWLRAEVGRQLSEVTDQGSSTKASATKNEATKAQSIDESAKK